MLKTKSKSSKQISKKKTIEKYPSELIEQVYKMTYAMLKWKHRDCSIEDEEIVEMAVGETVKYLKQKDYIYKNKNAFNNCEDTYFLYKSINFN